MKMFSRFRSGPEAPEQEIPAARLDRLHQTPRRRLGDAIGEVFYHACVQNDLRSAAGLLAVLSGLDERGVTTSGADERRTEGTALTLARAELDRCRELNRCRQAEETGQ